MCGSSASKRVGQVGQLIRHPSPLVRIRSGPRICCGPSSSRRAGGPADADVHRDQAPRAEAGACSSSTGSPAPRSRPTTGCIRVTSPSGTRSSPSSRPSTGRGANQVYSDLRALKVDLQLRDRRDQEPRDLLRAPRRRGRRPDGRRRGADRARLRLGRRVARRSEGDRDRGPRLGLDGVRLGRAPPLQLHRRRAEHVPGLERDAARRARRLRARLLPRLPDRSRRLHRRVLREPRLGRRQRLDRGVRHPVVDAARVAPLRGAMPRTVAWCSATLIILGGLPRRLDPLRCRRRRACSGARTSASRAAATSARSNVWRAYGRWLGVPVALLDVAKGFVPALVGLRLGGEWVGVLAGAAAMLGHARPDLARVHEGRQDGRDGRGRHARARPARRRASASACLDRDVRALPLRVARVDRDRGRAARSSASCSASPGRRCCSPPLAALAVVLLHRQNIGRLLHGTESRFSRVRPISPLRTRKPVRERRLTPPGRRRHLAAKLADRAPPLGQHVVVVDRLEVDLAREHEVVVREPGHLVEQAP